MSERAHRAMDGEIARGVLTPQERRDLTALETAIGATLQAVPMRGLPDLAPAVLERIAQHGAEHLTRAPAAVPGWPSQARRLSAWLRRPRQFALRPAYALAAAAIVAIAIVSLRKEETLVPASSRVLTQFHLTAPDAREVALAGDFSGWKPTYTLTRTGPGVWVVVVPLEPGVYNYSFVVDGERWVADPLAPSYSDGFGGANSRLAVLASDQGSARQQ